ncbi:MAG: iron-containing alcohol dehydrogenase [Proteobacteria bacterium]|nr:iron-containing alcohol dehydrogenase [Pseudomonadota bacterium]MBU1709073.1 iron-containing alcohol dehydrogenase [Pseudomonadota bacterium]
MYDFTFHNPTKIIFGRNTEVQIGSELKNAGISKVLFVFGKSSIKASGLYDRVVESLNQSGIHFTEFSGVSSNPILSHTHRGVRLAMQAKVQAVLAVGGGSVIDESKAIAVGAVSDKDVWEYFIGEQVTRALPVFTILTLAATGSEMNGNAVITREETQQKYNIGSAHVYPKVSILNPELTFSVSPEYSAYGAVDAIAHVIEGYFTSRLGGPAIQDRLVENIIRTVIDTQNVIAREPDNYNARAEFMWAATLALNGLPPAGIGAYSFPNHMIEHALSAMFNIAHGAGLAIVIPAWMRWYQPLKRDKFRRFAQEIFGLETGEQGIDALEDWFEKIGAPIRLDDAGIPASDIDSIAENANTLARRWGIDDVYTPGVIAEILRLAV